MAYLPWSQLWMQKQLHTSEDLATSPSGFGYVTSTIPGKSLAHWGQIINIQTLNPVHSMNLGVALSCEPGVPWKIWFRWSPMDQRTFVEVQDSNREVAVPKKKKIWDWMPWKEWEEQTDFVHITSSPWWHNLVPRGSSQLWLLPQGWGDGDKGTWVVSSQLPQMCGALPKSPSLSPSIHRTVEICTTRGWRKLGEQ